MLIKQCDELYAKYVKDVFGADYMYHQDTTSNHVTVYLRDKNFVNLNIVDVLLWYMNRNNEVTNGHTS